MLLGETRFEQKKVGLPQSSSFTKQAPPCSKTTENETKNRVQRR
jgi:hypothetical protein